jgi:hypothetical protein
VGAGCWVFGLGTGFFYWWVLGAEGAGNSFGKNSRLNAWIKLSQRF